MFLEMLAAERGAAANTSAAYRRDLEDFGAALDRRGRGDVDVAAEDIRALAHPVLRHRIVTNFSAEAEGYTPDRIIDDLLSQFDPTRTPLDDDERVNKVLSA